MVVLILALGSGASDQIRLRQEETILAKLPLEEARDYYELLRRRVRKMRILRALALVSLTVLALAYKRSVTG